jgi:hypothetical protein
MRGRMAIMEVLEVNEEIQEMILKSASEEEIFNAARKHGFMTMKEDAIAKALAHKIPLEEMNIFGTKIGLDEESLPESTESVDKLGKSDQRSAIISSNENTSS